jgi:hypothetical protein
MKFVSLLCVIFFSGCVISIDGDFSDIDFSPDNTIFGVLEQYDINNKGVANPRSEDNWEVDLFFSSAKTQSIYADWRFEDQDDRLALKQALAMGDTLWLQNLPLNLLMENKTLSSENDDFQMVLVQNPPLDEPRPLGELIIAELSVQEAQWESEGYAKGNLTLVRKKANGQPDYAATGTVRISFKVPLVGERIAKSNLDFIKPILSCAQIAGQMAADCAFNN